MNVCVQGLWHLGTVTAACLASFDNSVTGLDFDQATVARLKEGKPPVSEPGLDEALTAGHGSGRLRFTTDAKAALRDVELLWVAYDTPVDDEDNADSEFVVREIERSMAHLPAGATVLISSQLPVGSVRRIEATAAARFPAKELGFAYSPENLRLGKALDAFLKPDRIVVGVRAERDRDRLSRLLWPITTRIEWMSIESAEMTKHAINAFLATSVTFANEIAAICETVGADAKEVERGLKTEARIGPRAYLSPGAAFAGGTLARDVAFLTRIASQACLTTPLLASIRQSNEAHKGWVRRKLQSLLPGLAQATIAVWGLTYKPGTDTLRRSMAVELCDWLLQQGVILRVHDPAVTALPENWRGKVLRSDNPLGAVRGASALVVCTEWPQYRNVGAREIAAAAPGLLVLDANRFLSALSVAPGLTYAAVGTAATVGAEDA